MEKNKLIIGGVVAVVVIVIGVFIILKQQNVPVVNDKKIVAPRAILKGNVISTHSLPVEVKQGYAAVFNIYSKNQLVGVAAWKGLGENMIEKKIIGIPPININEPKRVIEMKMIEHDDNYLIQRVDTKDEFISRILEESFIFDYQENKITNIRYTRPIYYKEHKIIDVKKYGESTIIRQKPNAFERIDLADLYVGWRREFPVMEIIMNGKIVTDFIKPDPVTIEVIGKATVTVPAGTFDVLRIKIKGLRKDPEFYKIYGIYYITSDGRLVKKRKEQPDLVFKLRDYSKKEGDVMIRAGITEIGRIAIKIKKETGNLNTAHCALGGDSRIREVCKRIQANTPTPNAELISVAIYDTFCIQALLNDGRIWRIYNNVIGEGSCYDVN